MLVQNDILACIRLNNDKINVLIYKKRLRSFRNKLISTEGVIITVLPRKQKKTSY